jgi:TonB-linked SusC/RagA family outer membrane protein
MDLTTVRLRAGLTAKIWKIMRLTAIFLLALSLHLGATGHTQGITLSKKGATIESIFKEIEKQSVYEFFYRERLIPKGIKRDVQVTNADIKMIMELVLKDLPLSYEIVGQTIVIKEKAAAVVQSADNSMINLSPPIDIAGKVTDADGNPLAGATVKVKGTNQTAIANNDGVFVLKGVDENATLEISYVGYETYTVAVSNKTTVVASLKVKLSSLDEMQVIAYGNRKVREQTGNVTSVKANVIQNQPVGNPLLALQGRVPGLFITQSTGLPGSGVTVRIQGQNSISKGNDPLYIIDGVPYTSQTLPSANTILGTSGANYIGSNAGSGNPLSYINPQDIESIEILKDADATAIYGSRAGNGAILITTKKGKAGQTRVVFNMQKGWGSVANKLDLLNTHQYLKMRKEGLMNDNAAVSASDYDINGTWDTTRYTDWQKGMIGNTAQYMDLQTSVSGGNSHVQFLIGGGYHKETTVFPGNFNDQKGSLHFNINSASANQKFKIQFSGNFLADDNRLPIVDVTQSALILAPNAPDLFNKDGSINWAPLPNGNSSFSNPLSVISTKYTNTAFNLISNAVVGYQILNGLELKASLGYTRTETREINMLPLSYFAPEIRGFLQRTSNFTNGLINSWIAEPMLTYNLKQRKGKFEALVGTTFQETKNDYQQLQATGFNSDRVMEDIKSATTITPTSSIISDYKYNAIFARANYNYEGKYLVNLSARRDGSSRFGSQNLFNNFWSVAGGWIFSKEKFIENNGSVISFGKLRASFGTTGNDQIGDYQFLNLYQSVSSIAVPYQGVASLEPNGIPNPYLQWEETKKLQFGFDLGLLKDHILLSVNYNQNRSSNQLLSYSLPIVAGTSSFTSNFPAKIQNAGWEISLNTENIHSHNFSWSSGFNLTIPKNKLLGFPNIAQSVYANRLIVGEPFTIIKLYHYLGVNPTTGVYIYSDNKGNATSAPNSLTDKSVLFNTSPEYYGGFQNSFSYKGFELNFLLQFVKQKAQNYYTGVGFPGYFNTNQPAYVLDRWQKAGEIKPIQRYSSNTSISTPFFNSQSSDAVYDDASFVRIKNVSFSWRLPKLWLRKALLYDFRLFALGQNLYTITHYRGLDPETKTSGSAAPLPPLRVITIGAQLTL